jgi:hypothetical protein
MFYSPSTRGFYNFSMHGQALPPDAVAITDDEYAQLMLGQGAGYQIAASDDGRPTLQPPPPPPPPPPVTDVSFWQFMMAAWKLEFISHPEALAAVQARIMPPAFALAIAGLPAQAKMEAELKFAGITRMLRSDPMFALVVGANIATDEQIDGVFAVAGAIE